MKVQFNTFLQRLPFKGLFPLIASLFLILFFTCQKDEEIIPLTQSQKIRQIISLGELQATNIYQSLDKKWFITPKTDNAQQSQVRTSSNRTTETSSDDITIYTDKINQVIDEGYETYAMLLEYNNTKSQNTYYNLVLHKRGDNYYIYTLRFISSENNDNARNGGGTNVSGKPGIVPYDGWVDGDDGTSGGGDPDYECWEYTVTIENACTGSIPHFVGDNCYCGTDPDFPCTPPYNEVYTDSYCEYTGGDDNNPTPGGGDPDSNPDDIDAVKPEQKCPDGQVKNKDGICVEKPCENDPVKNPEIAPQKGPSGVGGALYGNSSSTGGCTRYGGNHCSTPRNKKHDGIDIKNAIGSPIHAMYSGFIYSTGYSNDYGYYATIQSSVNGKTVLVTFAHMQVDNRITQGSPGSEVVKVKAGDIIGYQGDTGNIKGAIKKGAVEPHVHIEVREHDGSNSWSFKNNFNLTNPKDYLSTTIDDNGITQNNSNCN